jgi:hypothetical protein
VVYDGGVRGVGAIDHLRCREEGLLHLIGEGGVSPDLGVRVDQLHAQILRHESRPYRA